jgi:hypothetical protein
MENELESDVGATATSGRPFLCPSGIEVGLRHKVLTEADIGNSGLGPAVERQ